MGGRGGLGGPPMMRGRGMPRGPMRGMGGPPRGMGPPRGGMMPRGGPPTRGGRPPGPPPQNGLAVVPQTADGSSAPTNGGQGSPTSRGMVRLRGGITRGGRGGSVVNGSSSVSSGNHVPPPGTVNEKSITPNTGYIRGHYTRGRGTYQSVSRQITGSSQPPSSGSSSQGMPVQPIKRGVLGGPPGPKRGRYDSGPQNRQIPLHHGPSSNQIQQHAPAHVSSYSASTTVQPT